MSVDFDAQGNLYIGDASNQRIRRVDAANFITTFAGMGGCYNGDKKPTANATLHDPQGIAVNSKNGDIYAADSK